MSDNKRLMQHAIDCAQQKNKDVEILKQINLVQLKKNTWFPCELAGCTGKQQTSFHANINENISLQWKFMEDTTEEVTRKKKHMWNDFLKWIITKPIKTNVDFKSEAWKCKTSDDKNG